MTNPGRWSTRRIWTVSIVGVLFVVLVVPLVFGVLTWRRIDRVDVKLPGSPSGGTTYLLVGSDSRAGMSSAADRASFGDPAQVPGQRADLILLVRVPGDGSAPHVLAVPRDLLVFVAPLALGRIGSSLNQGPRALAGSICRTLGIGVDHLALVRFRSFSDLVDEVGGVDVDVEYPERDTVLSYFSNAGVHHLDGPSALTYVRARHLEQFRDGVWQPDPNGAMERGARARNVLAEIGARAPSSSDPFAFAPFAWEVSGAVTVDEGSGLGDLRRLEDALHSLNRGREFELPVEFRDGAVPVAKLRADALEVLREFQPAADRGECAHPQLPLAGGTVRHG